MTNSSDLGPLILAGSGEYTPTMEVVDRYLLAACDGRPVLLIATPCAQEGGVAVAPPRPLGGGPAGARGAHRRGGAGLVLGRQRRLPGAGLRADALLAGAGGGEPARRWRGRRQRRPGRAQRGRAQPLAGCAAGPDGAWAGGARARHGPLQPDGGTSPRVYRAYCLKPVGPPDRRPR